MTRLRRLIGGWLLIAASCGPTPKPKPATASVSTDGQEPQSTEWLYATPGSSGVVKDECSVVLKVLETEQTCSGDLCRYGIHLAEDWLHTCKDIAKANVARAETLLATLKQRASVSGGDCAFQGVQLIEKGCPETTDCGLYAQTWATKCSEHTSPLVVRMIEKQVERGTQTPTKLDTTSCEKVFAELTKSTSCGNDFECEKKLGELKRYQARCVDPKTPIAVEDALKQALLLESAKQQSPPFSVNEARFAPQQGRLLLDDASGCVLAVGDRQVSSVSMLVKTLKESEYTLPVRLARIFSDKQNRHQLRLGSLDVPDPDTFFQRFPSLKIEGQREAESAYLANQAISKLNEVVKILDQQEAALAGLIEALALGVEVQKDSDFKAELAKADPHLAGLFEKLARQKRAKLPKTNVKHEHMRDRVAFARRTWQQPFADVTTAGRVELGAVNRALLVDVEKLLPVSFQAYREGMDGTVGKALRTLDPKYEGQLVENAQGLADACRAQRDKARKLEAELVACGFAVQSCSAEDVEKRSTELDEVLAAHRTSLTQVEMALLQLETAAQGKLKKSVTSCRD